MRFVSPRFAPAAAAMAAKIDEVVSRLAALLNGGLDLHNLKPGVVFPAAAFLEPASLVYLWGSIDGNMISSVNFGGPIPVASKLVAVGMDNLNWIEPWGRDVKLWVGGVLTRTFSLKTGRETFQIDPPLDVPAGTLITLEPGMGAESPLPMSAVLALRVDHVA